MCVGMSGLIPCFFLPSSLCHFLFGNHIAEEKSPGCFPFLYLCLYIYASVSLFLYVVCLFLLVPFAGV